MRVEAKLSVRLPTPRPRRRYALTTLDSRKALRGYIGAMANPYGIELDDETLRWAAEILAHRLLFLAPHRNPPPERRMRLPTRIIETDAVGGLSFPLH